MAVFRTFLLTIKHNHTIINLSKFLQKFLIVKTMKNAYLLCFMPDNDFKNLAKPLKKINFQTIKVNFSLLSRQVSLNSITLTSAVYHNLAFEVSHVELILPGQALFYSLLYFWTIWKRRGRKVNDLHISKDFFSIQEYRTKTFQHSVSQPVCRQILLGVPPNRIILNTVCSICVQKM